MSAPASKKADKLLTQDTPTEKIEELLQRGQRVDTPMGEGKIVDIKLLVATRGDDTEIEPPLITVRLDEPDPGEPKEVNVCMCKLGLENKGHEAIIKKEFSRLWPPLTKDGPEDIHMLVDVNKDPKAAAAAFQQRTASVHKVGSETLRKLKQRRAYTNYVDLAIQYTDPVVGEVKDLNPGTVVTGLSGVDLDSGAAVVLQNILIDSDDENNDPQRAQIVLYIPKDDEMYEHSMPSDFTFVGHDGPGAAGVIPTTMYDKESLDSPELHPIRILPNTFLPRSPNFPSSITDTVWRPTVRQTPIRFYQTQEKDAGFEEPANFSREVWPPTNWVNRPTPDVVNPKEVRRPKLRGKQVYERGLYYNWPADEPLGIEAYSDKKMEELAKEFWDSYQMHGRENKLPGEGSTLDRSVEEYLRYFAKERELEEEDVVKLLSYLVNVIGIDESTLGIHLKKLIDEAGGRQTRTHFHE